LDREVVLDELAEAIDSLERGHPVRVAVDGVGVSGKTSLADELVAPLSRRGRPVIRASIDGFHRPRAERLRRGDESPEGYLHDSFDYDAVREVLLKPLGPGGDAVYRTAVFDFRTDAPVESPRLEADPESVLIFDGVFVLRPELDDCWDFRVFVEASFDETLSRALSRDLELFGSKEGVRRRYEMRYIPGESAYLRLYRPRERADVVVVNNDPADASLEWLTRR
jgi:uridine kinase